MAFQQDLIQIDTFQILTTLCEGQSDIEFTQEGLGIGAGLATGVSGIELESIGSGFSGIVSSGGSTIEFTAYGITGVKFTTDIELEQSGSGFAGRSGSSLATIELTSSGISFGTTIGTGQSDIEIETDGSGSFTIIGTGQSILNIITDGTGLRGTLGIGKSTIEISSDGSGTSSLMNIIGIGISSIEISSDGLAISSVVGIGNSVIEIETDGISFLSSMLITGTGISDIEISVNGRAWEGLVANGQSNIEIGVLGIGLIGAIGVGTSSILFTTMGLSNLILIATDYTCVVINTQTGAVSEYDNYDFNSFCEFNGKTLGCRADGIYELDGVDDNGVDIDAYVKWGFLDPNLPTKSRLEGGFLSGESTGDIKVTTICDEDQSCEDILKYLISRRDHPVRIAKGFKGRLYEVKIENVDGAGFTLNSYRILARELKKQR